MTKSGIGRRTPRPSDCNFSTRMPVPLVLLLRQVLKLAELYPDRVTAKGYWDWQGDCPGDIIGTALYHFDVGVPPNRNTRDAATLPWEDMGFCLIFGPHLAWLQFIQDGMDEGKTWGEAVAEAQGLFPLKKVKAS